MIRIPSMGYVVIGANVIAILGGILALSNGAMTSGAVDVFHQLVTEDISIFSTPMVVLGSTTIALAVCGILAVIVERWLKYSYLILVHAILLGILAAFQINTIVLINKTVDNAVKSVPESLTSAFANPDLRPAFNDLEFTYMCCGTMGTSSYVSNQQEIPKSCCQLFIVAIIPVCTETNSHGGCIDGVSNGLQGWKTLFTAFLITSIVIHIINIFLVIFYFHHIKSKR